MFYRDIEDIDVVAEDELSAGHSCVSLYQDCWALHRSIEELKNDTLTLYKALRDAPNEATRMACINSTIEKLEQLS